MLAEDSSRAACRSAAIQRAISLIQHVCDIAAPRNDPAETREHLVNAGIVAAVANHQHPQLFLSLCDGDHQLSRDRDGIASDYLDRHGRVQWADLKNGLSSKL